MVPLCGTHNNFFEHKSQTLDFTPNALLKGKENAQIHTETVTLHKNSKMRKMLKNEQNYVKLCIIKNSITKKKTCRHLRKT